MARVLIVDDDQLQLALFSEHFADAHIVIQAPTSARALDALAETAIDMLVADVVLSRDSSDTGFALIEQARQRSSHLAAVVMTAETTPEVFLQARNCGAWSVFPKAWQVGAAVERLSHLLAIAQPEAAVSSNLEQSLQRFKERQLRQALAIAKGCQNTAAQILGIPRSNLRRYLKELAIDEPHWRGASDEEAADKPRVLFIDDDARTRRAFAQTFGSELQVHLAADAKQAIAYLKTDEFDGIVCDIFLADMSGIEIFEQATKLKPKLRGRFAFVTGAAADSPVRSLAGSFGCPVLQKPFERDAVLRLLQT